MHVNVWNLFEDEDVDEEKMMILITTLLNIIFLQGLDVFCKIFAYLYNATHAINLYLYVNSNYGLPTDLEIYE